MPAKTYEETLLIKQRYADLTPDAFKVLKEALASEDKADKKWAVEQLNKAFVKMIPQAVEGVEDGQPNKISYDKALDIPLKANKDSTES